MTTPWAGLPEDATNVTESDEFEYLVRRKLMNHRAEQKVREILRGPVPLAEDRWLDDAGLDALPDPAWLVGDLLPDIGFSLLVGKEGSLKSFVALGIAASSVFETTWLGRTVAAGPVVFVAAEGLNGTKKRWQAQKRTMWARGHTAQHDIRWDPGFDMMDEALVLDFAHMATDMGAKLVVLDTLARTAVGANDSSSQDMGLFVRHVDRIVEATNGAVLVLHHSTKATDGDPVRGSSALAGAAFSILHAVKERPGISTVRNPKQKDAGQADDFIVGFQAVDGTGSGVLDHPSLAQSALLGEQTAGLRTERILSMIRSNPGTRLQEIVLATGIAKTTADRIVKDLISSGLVEVDRLGRVPFYYEIGALR